MKRHFHGGGVGWWNEADERERTQSRAIWPGDRKPWVVVAWDRQLSIWEVKRRVRSSRLSSHIGSKPDWATCSPVSKTDTGQPAATLRCCEVPGLARPEAAWDLASSSGHSEPR